MEDKNTFHSGFVALVGRPNVGKSTLVNKLMKQKIAAVSPRPQTTRRKQLGILTSDQAQIIFTDTPGVHEAHHKLGEYMNEEALFILQDADVILWLVDTSANPHGDDLLLLDRMKAAKTLPPVILVLNKIDLVDESQRENRQKTYTDLLPEAIPHPISALNGLGVDALLERIINLLPEGPLYFDSEQITDLYEREIAADLIREAALIHLRDEVPHAIAVRVDQFTERGDTGAKIDATIFVERDSHKGIVIGKGGSMLKQIGSTARGEIEAMSGRKVYLELRVKVNKNWRNDPDALSLLGYTINKD
ncbi:MAG: GTPase Era [Anaerolineaceae bacterium]|nr:GTPase Era [Anaerolineaceae bacterium]